MNGPGSFLIHNHTSQPHRGGTLLSRPRALLPRPSYKNPFIQELGECKHFYTTCRALLVSTLALTALLAPYHLSFSRRYSDDASSLYQDDDQISAYGLSPEEAWPR